MMTLLLLIALVMLVLHFVKLQVNKREATVQAKYQRFEEHWLATVNKDFCKSSQADVLRLLDTNEDKIRVGDLLRAWYLGQCASRILIPDTPQWRPAVLALRQLGDLEDAEEALDDAAPLLGITNWKPLRLRIIDVAAMLCGA